MYRNTYQGGGNTQREQIISMLAEQGVPMEQLQQMLDEQLMQVLQQTQQGQGQPQMEYGGRNIYQNSDIYTPEDMTASYQLHDNLKNAEVNQGEVDDYYNNQSTAIAQAKQDKIDARKDNAAENRANYDYKKMGTDMKVGSGVGTSIIGSAISGADTKGGAHSSQKQFGDATDAFGETFAATGGNPYLAAGAVGMSLVDAGINQQANVAEANRSSAAQGNTLGSSLNPLAQYGMKTPQTAETGAIGRARQRANNPQSYMGMNNSNAGRYGQPTAQLGRAGYYPETRARGFAQTSRKVPGNNTVVNNATANFMEGQGYTKNPNGTMGFKPGMTYEQKSALAAKNRAHLLATGQSKGANATSHATKLTPGEMVRFGFKDIDQTIRTNAAKSYNPGMGKPGKAFETNPVIDHTVDPYSYPETRAYGGRNPYAYGGGYCGKKY